MVPLALLSIGEKGEIVAVRLPPAEGTAYRSECRVEDMGFRQNDGDAHQRRRTHGEDIESLMADARYGRPV